MVIRHKVVIVGINGNRTLGVACGNSKQGQVLLFYEWIQTEKRGEKLCQPFFNFCPILWARPHPKGNVMLTDENENIEENSSENNNNLSENQSTLTETENAPGTENENVSQEETDEQIVYYITQENSIDYTDHLNQILGYTAFNMFFTFGLFIFFLVSCIVNFLKGFF